MHVGHDGIHIAAHLRIGHRKKRIGTVTERCSGTECYERVHVRRSVKQTSYTAHEKLLVDDHDNNGQKHLQKSHRHVVVRHHRRKRPAPHHMSHRKIHKYDQKYQRCDQAFSKDRRLVVAERFLRLGVCAARLRVRFLAALDRSAVSGLLNRRDNLLIRGAALHSHGVCQQAHRATCNARHLAYRFLDTG